MDELVRNETVKENIATTNLENRKTCTNLKSSSERNENKNVSADIANMKLSKQEFEFPSNNLAEKICHVVEYLFSDTYILKDKFLLKHIKRNKEGFVSLKLIASLRKVKALAKNWRVVAYSLEKSKKLQMNEEKTKIRRIEPIIEPDDKGNNKKILVSCLSSVDQTIDEIKYDFEKFGKIASVQILDFESETVKTYCKKISSLHKINLTAPFALIEFENSNEALNSILHSSGLEGNYIAIPFPFDLNENKEKCTTLSPLPSVQNESSFKRHDNLQGVNNGDCNKNNAIMSALPPKFNDNSTRINGRRSCNRKRQDNTRSVEIPNNSTSTQIISPSKEENGPLNKWTHRRQLSKNSSVIVLRQPKGPDGTIGFHAGRAKANLASPNTNF